MIEDKNIRELAVLIKLKSIYVSGCVHNYSPFKLSKSANLSRNTVKKYIDFYLKNGYARMEDNNLIFTSLSKIEKKYQHACAKIDVTLPLKKIQSLLHREIILDKVRKFNYLKQAKKDSTNSKTRTYQEFKRGVKTLKKLGRKVDSLPNALDSYSVSIKKLSQHFNCSVGKTQGIINSLCEDNLIKRITNYRIIYQESKSNQMNKHFIREKLSKVKGSWYNGSMMFQRLTNKYVL
jgi:hypothetical protein